jgi:hypothetical protein
MFGDRPGALRGPEPVNGHHRKREDSGCVRKGTRSVFVFAEPPRGRRCVAAADAGSQTNSHGTVSAGREGGAGNGQSEHVRVTAVISNLSCGGSV